MIFFIGVFNYYLMFGSKMKNKNTTPVGTIPKSLKEAKSILTHKYMTTHFSGLVQAL
jgi:hypothetical protein